MFNKVYSFIVFLGLIFLSKEFFYFDEEFVVVLSFFIIFFSLFNFTRSLVYSELESRSNQIFKNFKNFYEIKTQLLNNLESYYKIRNKYLLNKFLIFINNIIYFLNELVNVKILSLVYNVNRYITSSLNNIVLLENNYLKTNVNNNILSLVNDKETFFLICEDILDSFDQESSENNYKYKDFFSKV